MATQEFWARLVEEGLIEGDPLYYSDGTATPEEVQHAIDVAMAANRVQFVDAAFETGVASGDPAYWYSTPAEGDTDLINAVTTGSSGGGTGDAGIPIGPGTEDESPSSEGIGGVAPNTVSILTSKDMKWFFDGATGEWAVSYKLPNSDRSVVFSASGTQLDAIFGEGQRPTSYESVSFADLTKRPSVTFSGNISEVEGTGTFEGEVTRVISLALDEGILPQWAQGSGAVLDLLYIAQAEDKSQDWLIDNLAKLPEFKERFPNLGAFTDLGLTITEGVGSFLEMERGVKELVIRDGGNPATVVPKTIGDLISKGHSLTDVTKTFQIFDTMEKNTGALSAFNDVLAFNGQAPLTAEDQFEFMAGNAPKELYDLWENSSIHQAAQEAGLNLGLQGVLDIANKTAGLTSYDAAYEGLTDAAGKLLRYRSEIDFGQYGLNQEDIIDLSMGIAPSSGASQADVAQGMERAVMAARARRDRQRSSPFTAFSSSGKAQQASLGGVKQESA